MLILKRLGMPFGGADWFDTAVAHYLCQPEQKHDLATLAMNYLGTRTYDYDKPGDRSSAPLDPVGAMCQTATLCLQLKPLLIKDVDERGQMSLLENVEMPLVAVLADMEWQGARIDVAELNKLSQQLTARLQKLENQAYELAGRKFNVSSPSQVGQILFDEMQIDPKARKTKGGAWSTAERCSREIRAFGAFGADYSRYRGLKKLLCHIYRCTTQAHQPCYRQAAYNL